MVLSLGITALVGGQPAAPGELQAVVALNHCSGVLVAPDIVLTSAHCVQPSVETVHIANRDVRVVRCVANPRYRPLALAHDLAYCRLAATAPVPAIPIDDGPMPAIGQRVMLAGYGATDAWGRGAGVLRVVGTSIGRMARDGFEAGSAGRTACWGDSGGPILIERQGGLRVRAIVHGASGAICASPTQAVPLASERTWLKGATARRMPFGAGTWVCIVLTSLALLAVAVIVRCKRVERRVRS